MGISCGAASLIKKNVYICKCSKLKKKAKDDALLKDRTKRKDRGTPAETERRVPSKNIWGGKMNRETSALAFVVSPSSTHVNDMLSNLTHHLSISLFLSLHLLLLTSVSSFFPPLSCAPSFNKG